MRENINFLFVFTYFYLLKYVSIIFLGFFFVDKKLCGEHLYMFNCYWITHQTSNRLVPLVYIHLAEETINFSRDLLVKLRHQGYKF
jgi:hypothetical protein